MSKLSDFLETAATDIAAAGKKLGHATAGQFAVLFRDADVESFIDAAEDFLKSQFGQFVIQVLSQVQAEYDDPASRWGTPEAQKDTTVAKIVAEASKAGVTLSKGLLVLVIELARKKADGTLAALQESPAVAPPVGAPPVGAPPVPPAPGAPPAPYAPGA